MTDKKPGSEPGADFDESQDSDEPAFEWMNKADGPAAAPAPGPEEPHKDPVPTGALNVRPPQDEVERRRAERDAVARSKPVGPRIVQVLMAILLPFLLLIAAVRLVASPVFLWIEYYRPGFPGDGYGFTTDDRLTYGSYAVDYLANLAGPRYLGDLVFPSGDHLFTAGEVSHMADVKGVVLAAYGAGLILLVFFVFAFFGLRKTKGAFARGLFAGAFVTIGIIAALAILAALGWQQFFTDFHEIFFANGTWTFRLEDTLIRLFPSQFWIDSALVIGVLVALVASLLVIFCWPTQRRRARRLAAGEGRAPQTEGTEAGAPSVNPARKDAAQSE
ncbi:TIGR01906 family membrane protein [Sinomonas cyclohexanicum]|uniref:TIGR01906 family membrane protein n=1 Tax=Sinomonas cyclohexanicum TaxID=322009 RepID=UPI001E38958F|nr:TIGR01906 family membrane protein [Corynebacterium cyclohexanicum]